jgi:DNA-binding response OmpR family regulator
MQDMEGLELIRTLRKADPDVKIIAMSGGGHEPPRQYLEHAKLFGARRTLTKPFTLDELLAAVRDVLG